MTAPTPYHEPSSDETPEQRTRRRLQQRRCVQCGTPNRRPGRPTLCQPCRDKGLKYCPACEQVLPIGSFVSPLAGHCQPCVGKRLGRALGAYNGWQPGDVWETRTQAVRDEENQRVLKLLAKGLTWRQIADEMGVPMGKIRCRYYRWERKKAGQG